VLVTGDLTDVGRPEDLDEFRTAERPMGLGFSEHLLSYKVTTPKPRTLKSKPVAARSCTAEDIPQPAAQVRALPVPVVTLYAGHDGTALASGRWDYSAYRARLGPIFAELECAPRRVCVPPRADRCSTGAGDLCAHRRCGPATLLLYPEAYGFAPAAQAELDAWFDRALAAAAGPVVLVTHDPTCFRDAAKPAEHQVHPSAQRHVCNLGRQPINPTPRTLQYGPSVERLVRVRGGRVPAVALVLNGQYHTTRLQTVAGVTQVGLACATMAGIDGSPRSYAVIDLGPGPTHAVRLEALPAIVAAAPAAALAHLDGSPAGDLGAALAHALRWHTRLPRGVQATRLGRAPELGLLFAATHQFGGDSAALVLAVGAASGEVVWSRELEAPAQTGPLVAWAAGGTPLVLLALSNGRLLCLDAANGAPRWAHTLPGWPDRVSLLGRLSTAEC
jgi:hypothetical protein